MKLTERESIAMDTKPKEGMVVTATLPRHLAVSWRFSADLEGYDPAFVSRVQKPDISYNDDTMVFITNGSSTMRQPNKLYKVYGKAKITFGREANNLETPTHVWLREHIDVSLGIKKLDDIKRKLVVTYFDRVATRLYGWTLEGVWINRVQETELDGNNSDNIYETLTLNFDKMFEWVDNPDAIV